MLARNGGEADGSEQRGIVAAVVVPAHNEEASIGRLLEALVPEGSTTRLHVVVVCNGCTDATANVVREFGRAVDVLEIQEPSKQRALRTGDAALTQYPRVYVDADVVIAAQDIERLTAPLQDGGPILATGPRRRLDTRGASWLVRWYYDTWSALPQVDAGLFGRGVIALSREGHERVRSLPPVMADDLAISESFAPAERRICMDAQAHVAVPRTVRDLLRRRIRVHTGNTQADQENLRGSESRTSLSSLGAMIRHRPQTAPKVLVFVGVTVVARLAARRRIRSNDFTTWLRDDSSRG